MKFTNKNQDTYKPFLDPKQLLIHEHRFVIGSHM